MVFTETSMIKLACAEYRGPDITFWRYVSKYDSLIGCFREGKKSQLLHYFFAEYFTGMVEEYTFPDGSGPPTCICTVGPMIIVCCNVPTTNGVDRIHVFGLGGSRKLEKIKSGSLIPSTDTSMFYSSIAANGSQILISVSNSDRLLIFEFWDFLLDSPLRIRHEPAMEHNGFQWDTRHWDIYREFYPTSYPPASIILEPELAEYPILQVVYTRKNAFNDVYACITQKMLRIRYCFNLESAVNGREDFEVDPEVGSTWTHLAIGACGVVYACSQSNFFARPSIWRFECANFKNLTKKRKVSCTKVTAITTNDQYLLIADDIGMLYFLSPSSLKTLHMLPRNQIGGFVALGFAPYDKNVVFGAARCGWCEEYEIENFDDAKSIRAFFVVAVLIAGVAMFLYKS